MRAQRRYLKQIQWNVRLSFQALTVKLAPEGSEVSRISHDAEKEAARNRAFLKLHPELKIRLIAPAFRSILPCERLQDRFARRKYALRFRKLHWRSRLTRRA